MRVKMALAIEIHFYLTQQDLMWVKKNIEDNK